MNSIVVNSEFPPTEVDASDVIAYVLWYHRNEGNTKFYDAISEADSSTLTQIANTVLEAFKSVRQIKTPGGKEGRYKRLIIASFANATGLATWYMMQKFLGEPRNWKLYYFEADGQEDPCWVRSEDYDKFVRTREWCPHPCHWREEDIPVKDRLFSAVEGLFISAQSHRQRRMEKRHPGSSKADYTKQDKFKRWCGIN